ncbi:hypothetical protein [Williamsia maris]|uniref:hypothetical protein n=1 Tax=Williamsia maris TaxID=72806 RepID=UPI0020A50327|nr:hypothetical protein [Williamsia maris]
MIAELETDLPARVLADADMAGREVARFDAELGDEIAPFASVLLRSESVASSTIEKSAACARAIAEAEALGTTGGCFRSSVRRLHRSPPRTGCARDRRPAGLRATRRHPDVDPRRPYFEALGSYREGNPAPIVERLSEASILADINDRHLVSGLRTIRSQWNSQIIARSDSAVHRVADLLIRQPVFDALTLRRKLGITTGNARRYIDPLVTAGVIIEFTDRACNRAWRAPEVLGALDGFAERAGRRTLGT